MQSLATQHQKNFLAVAMNKYVSSVKNMENTVMLPSLLRDVPIEDEDETKMATISPQNLYECYSLLKSFKNTVESSILPFEPPKRKNSAGDLESEEENEEQPNLEKLFHIHLLGLYTVLDELSNKANTLTKRYKEIIGLPR
ncbi:mid1-interacting protein 1-B-like [Callorhinchus milii]|uniref:Mid1-interacting protein 1-B n=1 Tax=Callorhinchus milii TaxID=7868 RepID=K4FTY4_CALMI|nr:mid1-interacting protein 1-B-like [Callorhinchus milii]AFK11295.1 Mid1-interacting protein 1-B [Callorhinchus milii]AFM90315.1 Mid1-interacting protein 1-B [Callorhinchus milii]|eukprot:gi/632948000/ref/XP_007889354.1/ PREDICTED: mid1-interacting protein 1-B-like [Callorhinchus milii]